MRRRTGLRDLVQRPWLAEILVYSPINERIVARYRLLEIARRHRNALVLHFDLLGEFAERIGGEEESGFDIDVRWVRIPPLARYSIGVEDGPDRPAPVVTVADAGKSALMKLLGLYLVFLVLR
jgi:hypothetical protein